MLNQNLVNELLKHQLSDGKCYITQKEIAINLNISPTYVSKMIRRLQRTDKSIEKIDSGVYKVNHPNLIENGLYKKIIVIFYAICIRPDIANLSYERQSEIFKISIKELRTAYGYINNI